ncbi:MAG: hypothetical protein NTZ49_01350 [Candidatus Parcubacteria bacterium]|nr:hypothetical protein [Candidatus Parcubacteria bacterium]
MKFKSLLSCLILAFFLFITLACPLHYSQAQGLKNINPNLDATASQAGVKGETDLAVFIGTAVQVLFSLLGLVFVILIIYGGFQYMTASGSEEKAAKARKIIISAVIGLIIIIASYSIAYFITTLLENAS